MSVIMWEVRTVAERVDELVAWVVATADPAAQVYRSHGLEPRVVVIDPTGRGLPEVPAELLARAPHSWPFEAVPR